MPSTIAIRIQPAGGSCLLFMAGLLSMHINGASTPKRRTHRAACSADRPALPNRDRPPGRRPDRDRSLTKRRARPPGRRAAWRFLLRAAPAGRNQLALLPRLHRLRLALGAGLGALLLSVGDVGLLRGSGGREFALLARVQGLRLALFFRHRRLARRLDSRRRAPACGRQLVCLLGTARFLLDLFT